MWLDEEGAAFLYDAERDVYRRVPSAGAALTELLGPDRRAAAMIALQLAGEEDPLASALVASVAGASDCDLRRCWTVDLTAGGAAPDLRLRIDQATHLVRGVEITIDPVEALAAAGDVDAALREVRTGARGRTPTRIVVSYDIASDPISTAAAPAFAPPTSARLETSAPEAVPAIAAAPEAGAAAPADEPRREPGRVFAEEIEVRLRTVAVRVIDASGRAIRDLGPGDFAVRIGGEPAPVQSVDWISPANGRFSPAELAELARSGLTVPSPGRLIVVFVQTDLHPSRTPGHLRLLPEIRELLATLHPEDHVAVLSFDSHLKLRQDFTRDLERVEEAVWRSVGFNPQEAVEPGRFPSLARHLDFAAAKRAATPERALRVVGDALLPLPGEKVMILTGWGLGRYGAGGVSMLPEYDETRDALARARVTVFVLDITQADYHSLEVGLETIARDTGGSYGKTFRQPTQTTERLAHTLEGYYEIVFAARSASAGRGRVRVDLVGRRGQVLMRPTRLGGR